MINSLLKDSHMTQSFCHPYSQNSTQNRKQNGRQSATVNNSVSENVGKPANISFGGFFNAEKLAKSERFKKVLENIEGNPLLFEATFALGLTCLLRPAAIMALPGDKKNKGDKTYAASHSIASGVISYLISLAVTSPISKAFDKLSNDVKNKTNKFVTDKDSYLFKNSKDTGVAGTYLKKLPEALIALPRATITIALIPLILKYVFGMEKKKPAKDSKMIPISENLAAINHNKLNSNDKVATQTVAGGVK